MLKKIAAVLTAAMMTIGMASMAFAAPSPTVSGVVGKVQTAVDANGNAIEATLSEVPAENAAAVEEVKNIEQVKTLLGDAFVEGMRVVDVKDVTVSEGTVFPATITFSLPGVTTASKVAVLHYDTAAGAWEVVPSKVGNGTVEATFTSLSPVAFVVDGGTASNGTTSPKTGEIPVGAYAGVVAVVAVIGMAVVSFKKKEA